MWGELAAFAGAVVIGGLVPGPTMVVILRQTVLTGRAAAVRTLLGNEIGVLLWGLAAAFGLSGLVAASTVAYDVLRVAGAGVLVFLGIQALVQAGRTGLEFGAPRASRPAGRWAPFRTGLVTVVGNPKYGVFALSFLPQFVPAGGPVRATVLLLAAIWVVLDASLYLAMIVFVAPLRGFLGRAPVRRFLERLSGAVLIGLGVRLLVQGP